jgi:hypothetical protein
MNSEMPDAAAGLNSAVGGKNVDLLIRLHAFSASKKTNDQKLRPIPAYTR